MRSRRRSTIPAALAIVALTLTGCGSIVAGPDDATAYPQSDATSEDYQVLVDDSEEVLAAAGERIPESAVVTVDPGVTDLENDFHRMSCSNTTSQYLNTVDYYLAAGTDEIAIIDDFRDFYLSEGWQRADSVAEQMGEEQDPAGSYSQSFRGPTGFFLSVNRADDGQGGTLLQVEVFSPCIGDPSDKPASWGKF
jgi:hypothetical protein